MNTGKPIRLPAYMVTLLSKWQKTHKQLLNSLGRNPTNDEIATAMKLQREKIDIVLKALKIVAASHAQPTDEFTIEEKVVDEHESPEEIMQTAEDIEQLEQKLNDMDPREATVLRMRFGLNDQPTKTLEEVGKDAGLTRERVRQIQTKAISNLSKKMA
jgi:RNA polymerase primary sigma factor